MRISEHLSESIRSGKSERHYTDSCAKDVKPGMTMEEFEDALFSEGYKRYDMTYKEDNNALKKMFDSGGKWFRVAPGDFRDPNYYIVNGDKKHIMEVSFDRKDGDLYSFVLHYVHGGKVEFSGEFSMSVTTEEFRLWITDHPVFEAVGSKKKNKYTSPEDYFDISIGNSSQLWGKLRAATGLEKISFSLAAVRCNKECISSALTQIEHTKSKQTSRVIRVNLGGQLLRFDFCFNIHTSLCESVLVVDLWRDPEGKVGGLAVFTEEDMQDACNAVFRTLDGSDPDAAQNFYDYINDMQ